jgi:hypothetical protein
MAKMATWPMPQTGVITQELYHMNIADLLHSLTLAGLTLSQGQGGELKVLGPIHRLTQKQKQGLSEHKQTLLALTTHPTCLIPWVSQEARAEREAICWADSRAPEVAEALTKAMAFFDDIPRPPIFYLGLKAQQSLNGIEWAHLEAGESESPCQRCGDRRTSLNIIHSGESLRRDCAYCGRSMGFPSWYDPKLTQEILTRNAQGIRYNKASQGGDGVAPAGSNDSPLLPEGAKS